MDETERTNLIKLNDLYKRLIEYRHLAVAQVNGTMTKKEWDTFQQMRLDLQQRYGGLRPTIERYTKKAVLYITSPNKAREEYDADRMAFLKPQVSKEAITAIDVCIMAVNSAIGSIEASGSSSSQQQRVPEDSTQMPIFLFDNMKLHPKIIEVSESRFKSGHHTDAIFAAFRAVNNYVKEKTGSELDGKNLMMETFSKNDPIIKLNNGKTTTEKDEQEGFMHLFAGAMQGIRNPKAHIEVPPPDAYKTLEYLCFASLLMRRAEEGKLKIVSQPVKKAPAPSPR